MSEYEFSKIEKKWQKTWEKKSLFSAGSRTAKPKYYCLVMFPYPSGKLHMGHVRNYVLGDVFARFYRMKGFQVLHPIGWDAFGLPAENAAIKNKIHPEKWTRDNIKEMSSQLKDLGISYDWTKEISTCDPAYYKWNQWFFIKMWEKGLAFRKKSLVNWCPNCATVLANEQVSPEGRCWRCESTVENKELEQWFLKITDYAEELLEGHKLLKDTWPQEVLLMQENWIGKSQGAEVIFKIESDNKEFSSDITIFTTRPDTLFGATFMVLAPEHEIIKKLKDSLKNSTEVEKYITSARKKSNLERSENKVKTGIRLEGVHAVNPVNNANIPIFVADYVIIEYGTGAIMAVPAHDQRDWEFAKKFGVEIVEVIKGTDSDISKAAYVGEGVMVNSALFSGISSIKAIDEITRWLNEKGLGKKSLRYRLKDWLISRQRYWGTPIPVVYCENCGIVPVEESKLPVLLPKDVKLTGVGESPLAASSEFVQTKCPKCKGKARRETDTMDTFVDSSWYFARYLDPANNKEPFSPKLAEAWLPVDQYIGGIEHACMHLIYARFWYKVMRDMELVKSDEPFTKLLTQGMVTLGGSAMSKSRGNVVSQDEILEKYGADTARLFIMFASPPKKQLEWSSEGIEGAWRFLNRIWRISEKIYGPESKNTAESSLGKVDSEVNKLKRSLHATIKKVTNDIQDEQQLNTAIASVMELVNELYPYKYIGDETSKDTLDTIVKLLMPFTPHIAEEIWEKTGHKKSLLLEDWPVFDDKFLVRDNIELPVQINGKLRGVIVVQADIDEEGLKQLIEKDPKFATYLKDKKIAKLIYVNKKILNIIVN